MTVWLSARRCKQRIRIREATVQQCNKAVLLHHKYLVQLDALSIHDFQCFASCLGRRIFTELHPFIKSERCDFQRINPIRLDFSDTVCVVVINQQRVDYGYKYTRIMECICNRLIVCTSILHDNFCFTGQWFDKFHQLLQIAVCVEHIKGFSYDDSKGLNYSYRTFSFGYVNSNCVHKHLSYW